MDTVFATSTISVATTFASVVKLRDYGSAARQRLVYPHITWLETITGALLCGFCAVAAVCMPLFSGQDEDFPMKLFVAAFLMWAALGGVIVAARVMQWRLRRQANLYDPTGVCPASSDGQVLRS